MILKKKLAVKETLEVTMPWITKYLRKIKVDWGNVIKSINTWYRRGHEYDSRSNLNCQKFSSPPLLLRHNK